MSGPCGRCWRIGRWRRTRADRLGARRRAVGTRAVFGEGPAPEQAARSPADAARPAAGGRAVTRLRAIQVLADREAVLAGHGVGLAVRGVMTSVVGRTGRTARARRAGVARPAAGGETTKRARIGLAGRRGAVLARIGAAPLAAAVAPRPGRTAGKQAGGPLSAARRQTGVTAMTGLRAIVPAAEMATGQAGLAATGTTGQAGLLAPVAMAMTGRLMLGATGMTALPGRAVPGTTVRPGLVGTATIDPRGPAARTSTSGRTGRAPVGLRARQVASQLRVAREAPPTAATTDRATAARAAPPIAVTTGRSTAEIRPIAVPTTADAAMTGPVTAVHGRLPTGAMTGLVTAARVARPTAAAAALVTADPVMTGLVTAARVVRPTVGMTGPATARVARPTVGMTGPATARVAPLTVAIPALVTADPAMTGPAAARAARPTGVMTGLVTAARAARPSAATAALVTAGPAMTGPATPDAATPAAVHRHGADPGVAQVLAGALTLDTVRREPRRPAGSPIAATTPTSGSMFRSRSQRTSLILRPGLSCGPCPAISPRW
jgi:hypothetical protein